MKYQLAAAKVADQRDRDDQFHWWGEIFGCLFFNKTWIQWTRPFFGGVKPSSLVETWKLIFECLKKTAVFVFVDFKTCIVLFFSMFNPWLSYLSTIQRFPVLVALRSIYKAVSFQYGALLVMRWWQSPKQNPRNHRPPFFSLKKVVLEAYVDLRIQTDAAAAELAQVGPFFVEVDGRFWHPPTGTQFEACHLHTYLHDYMSTYLQVKDKGLQGMNPWEEADANVLGFRWDFHEGHSWDRRFCVWPSWESNI